MSEILRNWLLALAILILAILVSWLANHFLRVVSKKVVGRTKTHLDDVLIDAAHFPLRMVILLGGIELALGIIQVIPDSWQSGIGRLFFAAYYLLAYLFLYRLIGGLVFWYGKEVVHTTETDLDDKFLDLFRQIALIGLSLTVIVIVLGRFGIEVSALVTTLGIGSLAVALAAQNTLGDMITGFNILIDRPFKVGDRIEIQDIMTWGDVVEIGLRSTRILTRDNRMVSVPNSVIGKQLVVNHSVPSTKYRVQTHVGVAYGTDIEQARAVMIEAIQAQEWVMENERIEALFLEFGDSGLIFRVRCWIEHFVETRRIIDKMNTAIYQSLNEAGIGIPFPQRDLHIVSAAPAVASLLQNGRSGPEPD